MNKPDYTGIFLRSVTGHASDYGIKQVLTALSGGADSIAMTFLLKKAGINVTALHCNFHLRGDESDRDMDFVTAFCKRYKIPLYIKEFNVNDYLGSNKGVSLEMACRNLRFEWFERMMADSGSERLATGHNADDNIETFLLNMLRGAGTRGLKGMRGDNGKIWRPLISYHRNEILAFLTENDLKYVVDSTNLKSDYRRNFLRNKVIPLFKEEWKGFDAAMDKTIQNLESENRIVEECIAGTLPHPLQPLSVQDIMASPAPELIIKRYIDHLGPYTATPGEILGAIKAAKPHIRKWRLRKGMVYLRNGNLFVEMIHGEGSA